MSAAHAVTPTAGIRPRAIAAKPAREPSMSAVNLAISIADDVVRTEIEAYACLEVEGGVMWNNTRKPAADMARHDEDVEEARLHLHRALRYIGLRNPDAFPWRFVRHPDKPHLVRFEVKP